MRTLLLLLSLAVVLPGCSADCVEVQHVFEVEWGSSFEAAQRDLVRKAEQNGWTCRNDGAIRDAEGRAVGERYLCTKC